MRESEYTPDEKRVADFFFERGVGGGEDPVGAMIAGYAYLKSENNRLRAALKLTKDDLKKAIVEIERELKAPA